MKKWIISLGIVVLLLAMVCLAIYCSGKRGLAVELKAWQAAGRPTRVVGSSGEALNEKLNAATYYRRAGAMIDALPNEPLMLIIENTDGGATSAERLGQAMANCGPAYEQIYKGASCEHIQWNWQSEGGSALFSEALPRTGQMRRMARLVDADASWLATQGDLDAAGRRLAAAFALAGHAGSDPPVLMNSLVAIAIDVRAFRTFEQIFRDGGVPPTELVEAITRRDYRAALRRTLEGEAAYLIGVIESGEIPARWRFNRDLAFLLKSYQVYLDRLDQGLPFLEIPNHAKPPRFAPFSSITLPALSTAIDNFSTIEARRRMAEIAVRLRKYKQEFGSYPATLSALAEMPTDPFAGKPFVYERDDGGFVLQSAGTIKDKPITWRWSQ